MKFSIHILLSLCFLLVLTTDSYAQPGKVNKEKTEKQIGQPEKQLDNAQKQKVKMQEQGEKAAGKVDKEVKEVQEEVEEVREVVRVNEREAREEQQSRTNEAQGGKDPKAPKVKEEMKEKKGNAYGKDKGDMTGREFGQERARQAKLKKEERERELNETVVRSENKVKEANDKISIAKEKLEKEKAAGTLTDEEYTTKTAQIEKAEKAVEVLQEKLKQSSEVKTSSEEK